VNRRFRLKRASDFQRVRREGRSFAHPLVVLVVAPNTEGRVRVGVAAGRTIGKAVARNRAKRRLREVMRPLLPLLPPGWDLLLIARRPLNQAPFADLRQAVRLLLRRAGLLPPPAAPSPRRENLS